MNLGDLIADPARAAALSNAQIAQLLGECEAARSVLTAVLPARAVQTAEKGAATESGGDALLDVMAVAQRLGYARSHIYALVKSGEIAAVRHGKEIRVRPSTVERFITKHERIPLDRPVINVRSKANHGSGRTEALPQDARPQANRAGGKAGRPRNDIVEMGTRLHQNPDSSRKGRETHDDRDPP